MTDFSACRGRLLDEYRKNDTAYQRVLPRLMVCLFPYALEPKNARLPLEWEALDKRRMMHPLVFPHYFNAYFPLRSVPLAEFRDFIKNVTDSPPGERRVDKVAEYLRQVAEHDRLDSFFTLWEGLDIVLEEQLKEAAAEEEVCLGFALASGGFEMTEAWSSAGRRAASITVRLIAKLPNNAAATQLLVRIAERASLIGYAKPFLEALNGPEDAGLGDIRPDPHPIREAFDRRIISRYSGGKKCLLDNKADASAAILMMTDRAALDAILMREVRAKPLLLARVLEPIRNDIGHPGIHLDYLALDDATAHVEVDEWPLGDRGMVLRFRKEAADRRGLPAP